MTKRLAHLLLALAALSLLLAPLLPHHHHEGSACMALVHGGHTTGHNAADACHHGDGSTCVAECGFVVAKVSLQNVRRVVGQPGVWLSLACVLSLLLFRPLTGRPFVPLVMVGKSRRGFVGRRIEGSADGVKTWRLPFIVPTLQAGGEGCIP